MLVRHEFQVEHHKGWIEYGPKADALFMHLDCCEDATSAPKDSIILRLDWYHDEPHLYIWTDKEFEDPVEISLGGAVTNPTA